MSDLANAIKDLIINYEKACKSDYVLNPLCYSLYQTWKKYDLINQQIEQLKEQKE